MEPELDPEFAIYEQVHRMLAGDRDGWTGMTSQIAVNAELDEMGITDPWKRYLCKQVVFAIDVYAAEAREEYG